MSIKVQYKSGKKKGFPHSLLRWATDEMGLTVESLPCEEDLSMLLRGSAVNSWEYIREHIHSHKTVERLQQNLSMHCGVVSTEHAQLLAEKTELLRELSSQQLAISQTIDDISRLEADIVAMETANEKSRGELSEISNKNTLLSAHSLKCQETVNVVRELNRRTLAREELFRWPEKEQSYFTRDGSGSHITSPLQLESACKREVRCVCEEMVRLLSGGDGTGREGQRVREQVWSKLESLLSSHPPAEILQSLTLLTLELSRQIHSHTDSIDLTRDAQELRYQSGGGESSPLVQSVEDHLSSAHLDHVTRALQAKEVETLAAKRQEELAEVKGQLEERLNACCGDDKVKEPIRTRLQLDLDVCGVEEALSVLSQYVSTLQCTQSEKRKRLDILVEKKRRVGQFTETAERNRSEIQELVRYTSSLKGRLQSQSTEVGVYLRDSVCGVEGVLRGEAHSLVDCVSTEIQLFSTISLARANRAPGLDCQCCELSVHCLCPHRPSGSPCWLDLVSLLGLPPHTSPDSILRGLVECVRRGEQLSCESGRRDAVMSGMRTLAAHNKHCADVLERSQSYDRHLGTEGLGAVRACLSRASHGLSRCSYIEQTMKEWWEQPGQYSVPWVTCDGMSCDKWVEQWRVLTAKLRQLSDSQKC